MIMTNTPPVPKENQSPYPIEEAPHDTADAAEAPTGEALAAAKDVRDSKERWAPNSTQLGLGAAVGIGSAAIVAGLLYWRGGKKDGRKPRK
jgi:hypothetical protein